MKAQDIRFFQKIAEQIVLYCAGAEITNENAEELANKQRALFSLVNKSAAADAENNVDLKLNQNLQFWTAKEIDNMPFLKDLKYRVTKDGIHQFRYRRDGYDVSFNSKNFDVAKQKARNFIAGLKDALKKEIPTSRFNTLNYVANEWFNLKTAHTDNITSKNYRGIYKNHIEPKLGSRGIKSLLPMDLQPFFDELYQKHGRTCESVKVILNGIFKYAVANRLCPTNPMAGVIVEKHFRTPGQALTDEQIKRFKEKMQGEGKYGLAGIILLYTGVRGAELQTIHFDWERGTFTVKNAKLKKSQRRDPKNLYRTVPIIPPLWEYRARIESEAWRISPTRLTNKFKLHWPENTPKDLRHTFTTKAREAGVENELVNIWTGHVPGNDMTARVYTHFSIEYQKEIAKKITNY